MVKRSTWVLLILLILAVGAYFLFKAHASKTSQATPTPSSTYLVTAADGTLQSLQISDTKGDTVRMQRDPSKVWVLTAPTAGTADQGLAGAAESQVGALAVVTDLAAPTDLTTFQLTTPAYKINLTFDNGVQHMIEVGGLTPTGSGYYVRFDSKRIVVVKQDGIDSLLNLLKSPPYPATETPVPSDTPTDTLTATPTETPNPDATLPASASVTATETSTPTP